jgi:hypothetical protein
VDEEVGELEHFAEVRGWGCIKEKNGGCLSLLFSRYVLRIELGVEVLLSILAVGRRWYNVISHKFPFVHSFVSHL